MVRSFQLNFRVFQESCRWIVGPLGIVESALASEKLGRSGRVLARFCIVPNFQSSLDSSRPFDKLYHFPYREDPLLGLLSKLNHLQ